MNIFARFIHLLASFFDADGRELWRLRQEVKRLQKRNRRQQAIIEDSHRNNALLRREVAAQGKALRRLKAGKRKQPTLLVVRYDNAGGRQ
jgi:hypothetical protein